jgi:hypothetical protein
MVFEMWNQHKVNLLFKTTYNCSSCLFFPKSLNMFSISKKKKRKKEKRNTKINKRIIWSHQFKRQLDTPYFD